MPGRRRACRTVSSWSGTCGGGMTPPRPRSGLWSSGMARWCSAPAVACFTTSTPPRMLFRPHSSSWRGRPGRSASGIRSRAGSSAWRVGSRGGRTLDDGAGRTARDRGCEMSRSERPVVVGSSARVCRGGPGGGRSVAGAIPGAGRPVLPRGPDPGRSGDPAPPAGQHGPGAADAGAGAAARAADPPRIGPGCARGPLGRSRRGGDTRSPRGRNRQGRGPDRGRPGGGGLGPGRRPRGRSDPSHVPRQAEDGRRPAGGPDAASRWGWSQRSRGRNRRGKDRGRRDGPEGPRESRRPRPRSGAPR